MFPCIHDPGLALFLAETRSESPAADPLAWAALAGTVLLALMALTIPA